MKNIISVCWTDIGGLFGINQRAQPIETHVDRFRSPLPSPTISITSYLFMMESDTRGCAPRTMQLCQQCTCAERIEWDKGDRSMI